MEYRVKTRTVNVEGHTMIVAELLLGDNVVCSSENRGSVFDAVEDLNQKLSAQHSAQLEAASLQGVFKAAKTLMAARPNLRLKGIDHEGLPLWTNSDFDPCM